MSTGTGPLVPADEFLNHQITDTFAVVAQTDRSWTEKVCATAYAPDGGLQLALGLGKYANRGVIDAYAGVGRGDEQWTVRSSRALTPDVDRSTIGPIHYEILEPMRSVRFALDANDVVPVSFEWIFTALAPAAMEQREQHRSLGGSRLDADVVRYHQSGSARGWIELDGVRRTFDDSSWISTRDHSWGVRYMVGAPPADLPRGERRPGFASESVWMPAVMQRPDGSRYALHLYSQRSSAAGLDHHEFQGGIEHPDGRREPFLTVDADLAYRDDNRRLLGGTLHATLADGGVRHISVRPASDTGFHLGPGLYFGFDGHFHGQWRGESHLEGEHLTGCADPAVARRIHQHRDCVVLLDDPAEPASGWGNAQTIVLGAHPALGLTAERSFI